MNTSGFERFEAMPSLATAGAALIQFDIPNKEVVEENIVPFLEFWNVDSFVMLLFGLCLFYSFHIND